MQLPESLLALLLLYVPPAFALDSQWPHNLPGHMKYFPEDEARVKRGLSILDRIQKEKPIGVKKMSANEGDMFFLDNWIFAGDEEAGVGHEKGEDARGNATIQAFSPLRPHFEKGLLDPILRFAPRSPLSARSFRCPAGTNDCSSIGAPDSCCGTSDTCISITNTGFGSVGCCPRGQSCAGAISCDTKSGYSSCPGSSNGGCCLPGYSCQDVGCVIAGTSVTFVQPSTSAARASSTPVVIVPTTPSPTPTPTPAPTSSQYLCSTGWFACASSLGGGCCQVGRTCATGATCLGPDSTSISSQTPLAPVRPTANSVQTSQTVPTSVADVCPIGFYVCSAYYPGGCCRVGQDCHTTGSCFPTSSTVVVNTNGVVIVAPTGAALATTAAGQGGSCASGWYSCAASLGGNCCPNGYSCGAQCTATSGTQVAGKIAPSTASTFSYKSIFALVSGAVAMGVAMIIL